MLPTVRHESAPTPMGCRWCGAHKGDDENPDHGIRSTPGHPDHVYEKPTREQVEKRMAIRLAANRKPTPNTKEA